MDAHKDIHCRQSWFKFKDSFSQASRVKAASQRKLLYRAVYICAGTHRLKPQQKFGEVPSEEDEASSDEYSDVSYEDEESDYEGGDVPEEEEAEAGEGGDQADTKSSLEKRGWACKGHKHGNVQLHVCAIAITRPSILMLYQFEVSADDINTVNVYQVGDHPNANPATQPLRPSRRLRHVILGHSKTFGSRPSHVYNSTSLLHSLSTLLIRILSALVSNWTSEAKRFPFPEFRRHTLEQVQNIYSNTRQREKLAENAFEAITIIAEQNPECIFWYVLWWISLGRSVGTKPCVQLRSTGQE